MSDVAEDADRARALLVLQRVTRLTNLGRLDWRPVQGREFAFDLDLPSGNIEIGTEDNDGVAPFDLRLYAPGDQFILVYKLGGRDDLEISNEIAPVWSTVERKTTGIDRTLDGLIRDLDNIPPF